MNIERTADTIDTAQALQDDLNERALAAARIKSLPETPEGFDGSHCMDCEEPIHPARIALGRCRCVSCQQLLEFDRKMGARR